VLLHREKAARVRRRDRIADAGNNGQKAKRCRREDGGARLLDRSAFLHDGPDDSRRALMAMTFIEGDRSLVEHQDSRPCKIGRKLFLRV
jgi:hypothetical protein